MKSCCVRRKEEGMLFRLLILNFSDVFRLLAAVMILRDWVEVCGKVCYTIVPALKRPFKSTCFALSSSFKHIPRCFIVFSVISVPLMVLNGMNLSAEVSHRHRKITQRERRQHRPGR